MSTIIDIYGGPGSGKSTAAARVYAALKAEGHSAELVREYVKDWAWEGRAVGRYDELYVLGEQSRRESALYGRADWIVSDSPVPLVAYYARIWSPPVLARGIHAAMLSFREQAHADGHTHVNIVMNRPGCYETGGRYQHAEDACRIDGELRAFLADIGADYEEMRADEAEVGPLVRRLVASRSTMARST